jgi:hypothetical protein
MRLLLATVVLWLVAASSVFGCEQTLNVIHGQDVGYPDSYGIYTWDEAYVYQNGADTNPTFVRGVDLPEGVSVIAGVTFTRNEEYYDRSYDGIRSLCAGASW